MTATKVLAIIAGVIAAIVGALALVTRLRGARALAWRSRDWAEERQRASAEASVSVARAQAEDAQRALVVELERRRIEAQTMTPEQIVEKWGRK